MILIPENNFSSPAITQQDRIDFDTTFIVK